MAWMWTSLILLLLAYLLQLQPWKRTKNNNKRLPPGPRGFPIFGSLHLLGKLPHRDLHELAKQYGGIMHIRLGLIPTIVVSSSEAAELFLKTHDLVFASRPPHQAAKHLFYNQIDMAFSGYSSYWRDLRKICAMELLSNHKINSFRAMRKEEVGLLMEFVRGSARDRVAVNLSTRVWSLSYDMSCKMVFGKKFSENVLDDDRGFMAVALEGMHLLAVPNLADYIPPIARFDVQGLTKRLKKVSKAFDNFFEKIIDEHIQCKDEDRTKDVVDVMLGFVGSYNSEYRMERTNIKAVILDLLLASIDATATAIEWALSELIKNPDIMKKVQKELENTVGMERIVEESDLESLEYLNMVVKETLRLHPAGPLLLPHAAMEDCTVNVFRIPKNARVIVNAWAIGRDPNEWNDAEKFMPESFLGGDVDVRGHDFKLIPFGSGRRICPGMQLGLTVLRLVVAQLVHCFDWELPNGMSPNELDMKEDFGIAIPRAKHLLAIPTYRLHR